MISRREFIDSVFRIAEQQGYRIERNRRNGLPQIDFGHKKLHSGHVKRLYPEIMDIAARIPQLIEKVAPGRPCTHKPMRLIIRQIIDENESCDSSNELDGSCKMKLQE